MKNLLLNILIWNSFHVSLNFGSQLLSLVLQTENLMSFLLLIALQCSPAFFQRQQMEIAGYGIGMGIILICYTDRCNNYVTMAV